MSEVLYEQYKDALRRGHMAALRGRLDAAAAAYRDAVRTVTLTTTIQTRSHPGVSTPETI